MFMSYHCCAGQNHRIMTASWTSENMLKLNIWEWQIKNCIHEGMKREIIRECLLLFSSASFVLPVTLYKCETWSFT